MYPNKYDKVDIIWRNPQCQIQERLLPLWWFFLSLCLPRGWRGITPCHLPFLVVFKWKEIVVIKLFYSFSILTSLASKPTSHPLSPWLVQKDTLVCWLADVDRFWICCREYPQDSKEGNLWLTSSFWIVTFYSTNNYFDQWLSCDQSLIIMN